MKEDWKKEIIKAVLFVLLILVIGTLTVLLTDNSILLIISGMLIGTVDRIFDKWLDENWREEWYIVKEKIKRILEKIKDIFSLHCPECGGRMKSEYLDMEIDHIVYKCKKCGKEWL